MGLSVTITEGWTSYQQSRKNRCGAVPRRRLTAIPICREIRHDHVAEERQCVPPERGLHCPYHGGSAE